MNATITIFSNDPNNPTYDVSIIGNAISELSDSVCGTLTLINSPYSFTNDIIVPLGCTLTIEPGVLVNGNGYNLTVNGQLNCIGTNSDSIRLRNITTISLGNDSLGNHQIAYTILEGGIFFDDFQVNDYLDKWTGNTSYMARSTSYGNPTSGYGMQFYASDVDEEFISNSFIITEEGKCNISWDYKVITSDVSCYLRFKYRLNGGNWVEVMNQSSTTSWITENHNLDTYVNGGDVIEFMIMIDVGGTGSTVDNETIYFDNFEIVGCGEGDIEITSPNVTFDNSTLNVDDIQNDDSFIDGTFPIVEGFEFGIPSDWYKSSTYYVAESLDESFVGDKSVKISCAGSNHELETPNVLIYSDLVTLSFWYKITENYGTYSSGNVYYSINDGSYVLLQSLGTQVMSNFQFFEQNILVSPGDQIKIKIVTDVYNSNVAYTYKVYVDEIKLLPTGQFISPSGSDNSTLNINNSN